MTGGEVVLFGMTAGELALAGGSLVSAIGQLQAGANAQRAANFNAQVAFNNANAARLAALEDAKRQKRLGLKRKGARRALDPDKLDLLEDSALEEELAVQSFIHAGEVQAVGFGNTARLEIARGKSARSAATFGAFSSVLIGGAKAFGGAGAGAGAGTAGTVGSAIQFNPGNINRVSPFLLAT
jgi:hypothetical protein